MTTDAKAVDPDVPRLATEASGRAATRLDPVVIGFGASLLSLGPGAVVGATGMKVVVKGHINM